MREKSGWDGYEIRDGGDGKPGIYVREFNCRLATFNANTTCLQRRLKRLFDGAHKRAQKPAKPKPPSKGGPFSSEVGRQRGWR